MGWRYGTPKSTSWSLARQGADASESKAPSSSYPAGWGQWQKAPCCAVSFRNCDVWERWSYPRIPSLIIVVSPLNRFKPITWWVSLHSQGWVEPARPNLNIAKMLRQGTAASVDTEGSSQEPKKWHLGDGLAWEISEANGDVMGKSSIFHCQ